MAVFSVYKKAGEGLNELLLRVRSEKGLFSNESLTYAGRLDPLAEGTVIVLSGDDRFEKEKYTSLDKEYEVDVLFGIETDTLDPLGLVTSSKVMLVDERDISSTLKFLKEITSWKYPKFSSKTFEGKPLFVRTRSGEETPDLFKEGRVYETTFLEMSTITTSDLLDEVKEKIQRVSGDFRQVAVRQSWEEALSNIDTKKFSMAKIKVVASSGIYMRELARLLGERLGTHAIAFHIKRTRVGGYR